MEHNVYLCGWAQSFDGFCLWTITQPQVRAEGATYAEAEERLLKSLWEHGGAMHAVFEFTPPLPKKEREAKYADPELYLVCGADRFETDGPRQVPFERPEEREARLVWLDAYFAKPVCRKCSHSKSSRSEKPLEVTHTPTRWDGAFGYIGPEATATVQIFSEEFMALLSPSERKHLTFRPVVRAKMGRVFYELIGPAGPPLVAVSHFPAGGWRCSACGYSCWGYWIDGFDIHEFVARADLHGGLPSIFTVGQEPEVRLCVTGARWRELVGKKGTRGFVSSALGVAPDQEVIRQPELPSN